MYRKEALLLEGGASRERVLLPFVNTQAPIMAPLGDDGRPWSIEKRRPTAYFEQASTSCETDKKCRGR